MQSGIRDAQNVTWKLREVLAGRLGAELLDSYQAERAPHVAQVTDLSQKMGVMIAGRDRKFIFLRNTLGPLLMRMPSLIRKLLPSTAPALAHGWLNGSPADAAILGRMLPQPLVCNAQARHIPLDTMLGDGFSVLALDDELTTRMRAADSEAWRRLGARFLSVRSAASSAREETDIIDYTGILTAWMKRYRSRVIVVRPDKFVAASDVSGLAVPG